MLRWGVLGTGNIARQFADGVRAGGSARTALAAVASRDEAKARAFAEAHDVPASCDYDALLRRDDVDAVYVSLPNSLHAEWTVRALEAGKHVLCEKPLAVSRAEAERMFAAARRASRTLVEAFMYRAHPQADALKKLVDDGAVGRVKLVRLSFCFRVRNSAGNVRFDPALCGGALMDVGCYCVNAARWLAGSKLASAHAVGTLHPSGVDEQTSGVLRFESNVAAEFTCGMGVQADNALHVCGEDGWLFAAWPWKPQPPASAIEVRGGVPPRQDAAAGAKLAAPEPRRVEVACARPLYGVEADAFAEVVAGEREAFVSEVESVENAGLLAELRRQVGLAY